MTGVDWAALLRRRASMLDLFRSSSAHRCVARQGTPALLDELRDRYRSDGRPPTVSWRYPSAVSLLTDERT